MGQEQRIENRLAIDSIMMPFIGSRESDHSSFQYFLHDTSAKGAGITMPRWLTERQLLHQDDLINLHLPFRRDRKTYDQGPVAWERWSDEEQAQVVGVSLSNPTPLYYPVFIELEQSAVAIDLTDFDALEDLVIKVIKDSALLKKGVEIYLGHLKPFFSRIGDRSNQDYTFLRTFLLDDAETRVKANKDRLFQLLDTLRRDARGADPLAAITDLEELRLVVESELDADLLGLALDAESVAPYIEAIKALEKKLYCNYNTIVMLYIQGLETYAQTG